MRLLVCEARDWSNMKAIEREIKKLLRIHTVVVIIEGEARGADTQARQIARQLGIKVLPFPADWNRYGRAAGPIRNRQMLDEGKPDLVLAFHSDLRTSKGTANMVRQARARGIKVLVFEK